MRLLITVLVASALICGVVYAAKSQPARQGTASGKASSGAIHSSENSTDQVPQKTAQEQPGAQPEPAAAGAYVDYEAGSIERTTGTKLLFFYAPWCPQCRSLESDIKQSGVPAGVTVLKVDYDSNQKLRQKYGVTLQTTMVRVDDAGNMISKFVAYEDPTMSAVTRALL